jgi:hypothetical protein
MREKMRAVVHARSYMRLIFRDPPSKMQRSKSPPRRRSGRTKAPKGFIAYYTENYDLLRRECADNMDGVPTVADVSRFAAGKFNRLTPNQKAAYLMTDVCFFRNEDRVKPLTVEKPVEKVEKPVEKVEKQVEKVEKPVEKVEKPVEKVEKPVDKPVTKDKRKVAIAAETPSPAPEKAVVDKATYDEPVQFFYGN